MDASLMEATRMLLDSVFRTFVEKRPFCVMVRATLERMLAPGTINALFREHAERQYERELLFSSVVEVMAQVVLQIEPTVLAAYRACADRLPVSDQALYDKLQAVEPRVSEALVRHSYREAAGVLEALRIPPRPWVAKLNVKVLDGNLFSSTQHRIEELRATWDAPLPGRALVVWEQQRRLVCDVFLTPDAHASERSLLPEVLGSIQPRDLWIADRNFCTIDFLCGIWDRRARFAIRQHGSLQGRALDTPRKCGGDGRGQAVFEQRLVILDKQGEARTLRRITVRLHRPTRDGDCEIHILSNLTPGEASAAKIADLYANRWTIEVVFLEMQQTLTCEINTLGYPKAALFAFCIALLVTNAVSMLKESLRAAHGVKTIDQEVSSYYLSLEIQKTYDGMMVVIPAPHWNVFAKMTHAQFAKILLELAGKIELSRYPKSKRGPKKPRPKRGAYHNGGHVSTFRVLAKRKGQK
jgi:hypothetical protein